MTRHTFRRIRIKGITHVQFKFFAQLIEARSYTSGHSKRASPYLVLVHETQS